MTTLIVIALIGGAILLSWLRIKAERAVARGINRAVQHKTVAKEKELTREVVTGRMAATDAASLLRELGTVLPFKNDGLPIIGAALYVAATGTDGFKIAYGTKLATGFESTIVVDQIEPGVSEARYTITQWRQVDGVAGATSMMASVRDAFVLVTSQMDGAQWVKRVKDDVESTLWTTVAQVAAPLATPPPPPPPPQSELSPAHAPAVDEENLDLTTTRPVGLISPQAFWLSTPDGSLRAITGPVVIGRNPRAFTSYPGAELWALGNGAESVSKSHAVVEPTAAGLKVTDLKSTNGTSITTESGDQAVGSDGLVTTHGALLLGAYKLSLKRVGA